MTLRRGDSALAVLQRAWEHVVDASAARRTRYRTGRRTPAGRRPDRLGDACRGLAVALALLVGSSGAQADGEATLAEYRIKAAFLLKFIGFIDWPAATFDRADAPFVIDVLGGTPLGNELERIAAGRQVNGHPVRVRLLGRGDSSAGSQVLFVGRAEGARLNAVVAATEGVPLLLVSESDGALALGSAINFVVVDDKVRFDVALRAINRAGLKISARLLAVARVVQPDPS